MIYIARKSELRESNGVLEQRFYILDEDNNYKLVKAHVLLFPVGTSEDSIDDAIAQEIKNAYELTVGETKLTKQDIKKGGISRLSEKVEKFNKKLTK